VNKAAVKLTKNIKNASKNIGNITPAAASPAQKQFIFYNKYNYGDNIFNLKFLFNISNVLKEKGITIRYLYNPEHIPNEAELQRYVNPSVLKLEKMENTHTFPEGAIELWMGLPINGLAKQNDLDIYFPAHYKMILNKLGIPEPNTIDTSLYQKEPYLEDIYNKLDPKFKDLDILMINAEPQSKQVIFHKDLFERMCIDLSKKYKVAITSPIEDDNTIPCTFKDKLMLQDIGAISTHAKYIIGVHSGPVTPCFTDATKKSVKKWILFADNGTTHSETNALVLKNNYDYKAIEENLK